MKLTVLCGSRARERIQRDVDDEQQQHRSECRNCDLRFYFSVSSFASVRQDETVLIFGRSSFLVVTSFHQYNWKVYPNVEMWSSEKSSILPKKGNREKWKSWDCELKIATEIILTIRYQTSDNE